jgi:hypothetical protein
LELRPFDSEAFESKLMDYATIEAEEPEEKRAFLFWLLT